MTDTDPEEPGSEPSPARSGVPNPIWPPPPAGQSPSVGVSAPLANPELAQLMSKTRRFCFLGLLLCVVLQPVTIQYGLRANRLAGRPVARAYIVIAVAQLVLFAVGVVGALARR